MNSAELLVQCVDNALAALTPGLLPGLIGKVGNFDAKQLSAAPLPKLIVDHFCVEGRFN